MSKIGFPDVTVLGRGIEARPLFQSVLALVDINVHQVACRRGDEAIVESQGETDCCRIHQLLGAQAEPLEFKRQVGVIAELHQIKPIGLVDLGHHISYPVLDLHACVQDLRPFTGSVNMSE